jgi:ADP-ribose pyrophosphatase
MRVREDEILRSNGERGIYGVVEKHDCGHHPAHRPRPRLAGRAVPLHHPGAGARTAAGRLGDGGRESRGVGARRAERGDRPGSPPRWTYLGDLWIAYGFTRQKHHVFLATGLTQTARESPTPRSTTCMVRSRLRRGVRADDALDGTIRDGCTAGGVGTCICCGWRGRAVLNFRRQVCRCCPCCLWLRLGCPMRLHRLFHLPACTSQPAGLSLDCPSWRLA